MIEPPAHSLVYQGAEIYVVFVIRIETHFILILKTVNQIATVPVNANTECCIRHQRVIENSHIVIARVCSSRICFDTRSGPTGSEMIVSTIYFERTSTIVPNVQK
jgi:hypothetical protein